MLTAGARWSGYEQHRKDRRYNGSTMRLNAHECRILGVLIEKAHTTPAQYPLSLNAMITGSNQKSNRLPLMSMTEEQVIRAADSLREKSLVREVMLAGSRVTKFRHVARDALEVSTSELVVLAELLLRGPQSAGELRSRASRMHPLESLEVVESVLHSLMERAEPFVRELPPPPGSRAKRYAQLLCPDLHPLDAPASPTSAGAPTSSETDSGLARRVEALEREVEDLRRELMHMAQALQSLRASEFRDT
jgi:uncharacterized protein YceH (UPF0502 family)